MRTASIPLSVPPGTVMALHCRCSSARRALSSASHASPIQPRRLFRPALVASYQHGRRALFTETLPTVLVPPAVFLGCFLGLWSYKIIMTIVFQNKIIYMPYMPPFARSEKMDDYAAACRPVLWEEKRIRSLDGTRLSLCLGSIPPKDTPNEASGTTQQRVVILYFQGNGASMPPRLPILTKVLRALNENPPANHPDYSIVALSYRGFWTSKGRASQRGIEKDAQATLAWVEQNYAGAQVILWGQSLGAGVAADLVARQLKSVSLSTNPNRQLAISGIILETPFIGIKEMLLALYPQKWLPYRYLWPFLRNWWDNEGALRSMAALKGHRRLPIQIVTAARDEIVPESQAQYLYDLCRELRLDVRRKHVHGALHNEVPSKLDGRLAIVSFVKDVVE
ncbi:alpha beta superfamily [Diplodia corticola]|uniref:Alpha beta superfamily n=1 Tax=Diplodia corticola TaxID=236234 RepID=A0A1J9S797_9PEZI|nr:alpha beta superfamily [Diplodia corticola]OJD35477.1 alpha beta superfamily [Diplodia corticola]